MAKRCRLIFWTRRVRRTTPLSATTTSGPEKASFASSPSPSQSRSTPHRSSGEKTSSWVIIRNVAQAKHESRSFK